MTEYRWSELRDQATSVFGSYPDAALEQSVLDVFEQAPGAVAAALQKIVQRVQAGKLAGHAGWMIFGREVANITRPVPDVVARDEAKRERALKLAELWLSNAGGQVPSEGELLDELFGTSGRLHAFDDEETRSRMLARWREQRPVAERLDREMDERARSYISKRAHLKNTRSRRKVVGRLMDVGVCVSDSTEWLAA